MIGPREAARIAVTAIAEVFDPATLHNVKLEEYDTDMDGNWLITVGYDAPVDPPPGSDKSVAAAVNQFLGGPSWRRFYKVVRISQSTGRVLSMKIREGVGA